MKLPKHKCGLYLEHNRHKDYYESTKHILNDLLEEREISSTEYEEMLKADSIWSLQWYPDTPIGSYSVYASTLEELLEKAAAVDKEEAV